MVFVCIKTFLLFCGNENVEDNPRSFSSSTSTTDENIEKNCNLIRSDHRAISETVEIDRECIRQIVTRENVCNFTLKTTYMNRTSRNERHHVTRIVFHV